VFTMAKKAKRPTMLKHVLTTPLHKLFFFPTTQEPTQVGFNRCCRELLGIGSLSIGKKAEAHQGRGQLGGESKDGLPGYESFRRKTHYYGGTQSAMGDLREQAFACMQFVCENLLKTP
jgi:hypothetical protein